MRQHKMCSINIAPGSITQVERFFDVLHETNYLNQVYKSLVMQREWIGGGWRRFTQWVCQSLSLWGAYVTVRRLLFFAMSPQERLDKRTASAILQTNVETPL